MRDLFQAYYAMHPFLAMIVLILCMSYAAMMGGIILALVSAVIQTVRESNHIQPNPKENYAMTKTRFALVALLALVFIGLQPGCGTFGNGKVDPLGIDLSNIDIDVAWVAADGTPYKIRVDENGLMVEGEFTGPYSKLVYTITEKDGIKIRYPNTGIEVNIKPKDAAPAVPPEQSTIDTPQSSIPL